MFIDTKFIKLQIIRTKQTTTPRKSIQSEQNFERFAKLQTFKRRNIIKSNSTKTLNIKSISYLKYLLQNNFITIEIEAMHD